MKKQLCIIILCISMLLSTQPIFAVAVTEVPAISPTPKSASPSGELDRIEKIKEMVAEKVAKLNLVERKGILGTVKETSTTQITIEDGNKNVRIIDIDELTKFSESGSKSFGISDIESGNILSTIGLHNKDTKRLLARFVTRLKSSPIQIDAIVSEKDRVGFTFTTVDEKGDTKTVSVETTTKTLSYTKGSDLIKSGFSKILVGERVLITGFPDAKNSDEIIASRIIHFTDVAPSTGMKQQAQIEEVEVTPTKSISQ